MGGALTPVPSPAAVEGGLGHRQYLLSDKPALIRQQAPLSRRGRGDGGEGSTEAGALILGPYRYRLWREWDASRPRVAFVLLNPSTADAAADDPTLRRCLGFARAWGFGALEVVNLFALRSPSPAALRAAADPIGPENDRHLAEVVASADAVVAGWGNHGALLGRADAVRRAALLPEDTLCLGVTAQGQPRHPLYVRAATAPVPFVGM